MYDLVDPTLRTGASQLPRAISSASHDILEGEDYPYDPVGRPYPKLEGHVRILEDLID